jgi:general secretion pathway protein I
MKARETGFTLLEMVAALALLALLVTVMLVAFGQASRSLVQVRDSDRLSEVARNLLDELGDRRLQAGQSSGVVEGGIRWVQRVSPLPGGPGQVPVMRVDLQLQGPSGVLWSLSTLVARTPRAAP